MNYKQAIKNLKRVKKFSYKSSLLEFKKYIVQFRDHQRGAFFSTTKHDTGRIILPTGTGKSWIQVAIIIGAAIKSNRISKTNSYVIASHRLLLNEQLLSSLITKAKDCFIEFDLLIVGSNKYREDTIYINNYTKADIRITNTTSKSDVTYAYEQAKEKGRVLFVVTTYHSFSKLSGLPGINVCCYDEAHTTLGKEFTENIENVRPKIKRNYFFTATQIIFGDKGGMNDEEIFGKVIYSKAPLDMMSKGEIVQPKIHVIDQKEFIDSTSMEVEIIVQGFTAHRNIVKKTSVTPYEIGAQLLVTCNSSDDLKEIITNERFLEFTKDIIFISFSTTFGYTVNGTSCSRTNAFRNLQSLTTEDAIILHLDILTEGIDIPSLTGMLPFRNLGTVKLLQTLGRTARLHKNDRVALYNNSIKINETDKLIKPFCWVIVPSAFLNSGLLKSIVKEIRSSYGLPVEEMIVTDTFLKEVQEELDHINEINRKSSDKITTISQVIEDIVYEEFILQLEQQEDSTKWFFKQLLPEIHC